MRRTLRGLNPGGRDELVAGKKTPHAVWINLATYRGYSNLNNLRIAANGCHCNKAAV